MGSLRPVSASTPGARPDDDRSRARQPPIADYALLGNGRSAALVAAEGSIDWWCPGSFDAPALFCRLLDADHGGYFSLQVDGIQTAERWWEDHTNLLVSRQQGCSGHVRLHEGMPWGDGADEVILRRIEAIGGPATARVRLRVTPDYGRAEATVEPVEGGLLFQWAGAAAFLRCPVPCRRQDDGGWEGELRLVPGAPADLWLAVGSDPDGIRAPRRPAEEWVSTARAWRRWAAGLQLPARHAEAVERSALALRLLVHEPTGARSPLPPPRSRSVCRRMARGNTAPGTIAIPGSVTVPSPSSR